MYNGWPPARSKEKDAKEQAEFYEKIKSIRGAKDLKLYVDDVLAISKSESAGSKDLNEALPLSVWEKHGFDPNVIKKNCPSMEHPQLGKCYTVTLITVGLRKEVEPVSPRVPL